MDLASQTKVRRVIKVTFEKITTFVPAIARASTVGVIRLYQKTHILRAPSCRFYPSCSQYMLDSIQQFGLTQGLFLGLGRLCRCHPLNRGGVDEVPTEYPFSARRAARRVERLLTNWKNGAIDSPRGSR